MTPHFIIMSSSYTNGDRISLDIVKESQLDEKYITDMICKIKKECGEDVSLSTHSILTQDKSWESVVKTDKFFKNVRLIDNLDSFIEEIKKDRVLKGLDVAKYILSKISCTHLKLEKLVYFCFADYLCKTKQRLFEDKIYAFKFGPVIKSVYEVYKGYGGEQIKESSVILNISEIEKEVENADKASTKIKKQTELESPHRSRILFAKDGISKLNCIDSTIEKYKEFSASKLVKMTHSYNTPWSKTYEKKLYKEISDDYILRYHQAECI